MDFAAIDFADSKENLMNECITYLRNIMELKRDWEKIKMHPPHPEKLKSGFITKYQGLGAIFLTRRMKTAAVYIYLTYIR